MIKFKITSVYIKVIFVRIKLGKIRLFTPFAYYGEGREGGDKKMAAVTAG